MTKPRPNQYIPKIFEHMDQKMEYHTPWQVGELNTHWPEIKDVDGIKVDDDDAEILERIVACVNACEGVDSADLTHGCYQKLIDKHLEVHFAKQDLEAQRDELLIQLKNIMSWIDNWTPNFADDPAWPADRDAAQAAIAKAEGAKS